MTLLQAILLAIVEGLTEFIPVSSTGHMILCAWLTGTEPTAFMKFYTIAIQFGAICSVLIIYPKYFFRSIQIYPALIVGLIPSILVGVLLSKTIDRLLESVITVAIALILGGIILLFLDRIFASPRYDSLEKLNWKDAFRIGAFQCLAMIPGVSRSAATIAGGMSIGFHRIPAAEFSFLLAVPTIAAATLKKMYDFFQGGYHFQSGEIPLLIIGNIISFIVAFLSIRFMIGYLGRHGFQVFGWYRILIGGCILFAYAMGVSLQMI